MTKRQAYHELRTLEYYKRMAWDFSAICERGIRSPDYCGLTPYQRAIHNRMVALERYLHGTAPAPESAESWAATRPPQDVSETAEHWHKNNWRYARDKTFWQRKLQEADGKIPELVVEYPAWMGEA